MKDVSDPQAQRVQIRQSEFAIGTTPDTCLFAILGSCVGTAIWDEENKVGGMNHILLPSVGQGSEDLGMIGLQVNAMEVLINGIIRAGGTKSNLKAKVFGGSKMIEGLSDVGDQNVAFVDAFLMDEGIDCVARSVGGVSGRKVQFWPTTGRAQQKLIQDSSEIENVLHSPAELTAGLDKDIEIWK